MDDIILVPFIIGYAAAWIFYLRDCRRRCQPLTDTDFAKLEQMIAEYQ